jgi:hypothetical protein
MDKDVYNGILDSLSGIEKMLGGGNQSNKPLAKCGELEGLDGNVEWKLPTRERYILKN